ncbi:hypothetical protein K402DRAFT_339830, partial [Aulographum hederae CBS 113979]
PQEKTRRPPSKTPDPREAILAARDLIVLASQLTQDRIEQTSILDLLQIFREYTEKGQVRYASSIIASQVASLENISRRIDSKTKIQKPSQPVKPAQPTQSPFPSQRPIQPQQTKASYAQMASPRTGETGKAEWTTVQKKSNPQAQIKEFNRSDRDSWFLSGPSSHRSIL